MLPISLRAFIGDSATLTIALVHPDTGAAISPAANYSLIWTAKTSPNDADADAVIQKATDAGITVAASTATIALVPDDTRTIEDSHLYWDIQAQHVTTGAVLTLATGTLRLKRDITRDTTTSIAIYTSEEAFPGGSSAWGDITGTLSAQTDLQAALDAKAASLGVDDNYVTDAEKTKLSNLSGTNTGDQDLSGKANVSHTHLSADVTDASDQGAATDAGKLVKYGLNGRIYLTGDNAEFATVGQNAAINTYGNFASISTNGSDAVIATGGANAHIYTANAGAYIQTRSTFKLSSGTHTTTIAHAVTGNYTLTLTPTASSTLTIGASTTLSGGTHSGTNTGDQDLSGKANIDAETHTGAHAFSSTTRPTSSGTGVPAAASLITLADGDNRFAIHYALGSYEWSRASGGFTPTNIATGSSGTASDVLYLQSGAIAGGSALLRSNPSNIRPWHRATGTGRGIANWSLRTIHLVRIQAIEVSGTTTVFRILLGFVNTNTTVQDLAASDKGIGFKIIEGLVYVQVANASAVTTTSTSTTLVAAREYDLALDCDGAGNWVAYINGASVASGTGAPTGNSTSGNNALNMSVTNGSTAADRGVYVIMQKTIQI